MSEPCPKCERESVYTCGCCPDCGHDCHGGGPSTCELTPDGPIDFDDGSDETSETWSDE